MFIAILAALSTGSTAQETGPDIDLTISPTEREVELEPGVEAIVNFTLEVSCQSEVAVEVDLKTKASWWDTGSVPILNFTEGITNRTVNITVEVPANMSASENYHLQVWGSWRYANGSGWGSIPEVRSEIDVKPFYDLYIGSSHPEILTEVGDWTDFELNITNLANVDANVTLSVERGSDKIRYEIESSEIYLEKDETRTVVVRVRQEPGRSGRYRIYVTAVFDEDPDRCEYRETLVLSTEPKFSTIFYERSFIYLIVVITIITLVALGLYIHERVTKIEDEEAP